MLITRHYFFLIFALLVLEQPCSASQISSTTKKSDEKEKTIWIRFKDEPLINIIEYLATEKGINVVPPQGANALTHKVTFELPYKVTLDKAWNTAITLLDLSGYTFIPHKEQSFITKNDGNLNKEALPIYVNTKKEDLPYSYVRVRYVRYLENIQVPGTSGSANSLQKILTDILSVDAAIIFEPILNAVIITDRSIMVKTALEIIDYLEASTFKHSLKILSLKYTTATEVKSLFDQLIGLPTQQTGAPNTATFTPNGYFEKSTKIVVDSRKNRLILMGKSDALDRIEEFIKSSIDVATEQGESILHIYRLNYLDALSFAPVLQKIVDNSSSSGSAGGGYGSGSGQSTASQTSSTTQYFSGVIITTDSSVNQQDASGKSSSSGNRLIVAATKNDWIRLEKLIEQLDQPQPQIVVKALIVDLTTNGIKALGSQIRNRKDSLIKNVSMQAGNIGGITNQNPNLLEQTTINGTATNTSLAGNLMNGTAQTSNFATDSAISQNATVFTVTDPTSTLPNDVWLFARILNTMTDSQVLAQPFGFGTNNQTITFSVSETRILQGQAASQQGVSVANNESVQAAVVLKITPRASKKGTLNIQIDVDVNQWADTSATGTNQNNRKVTTNVNMKSGEICFLGGLGKKKTTHTKSSTPLWEKIPFLNIFGQDKSNEVITTDLCVFIQAEMIEPSAGLDPYTRETFTAAVGSLIDTENFSALRDPISRWYFNIDKSETDILDALQVETSSAKKESPLSEKIVNKNTSDHNNAPKTPIVNTQAEKGSTNTIFNEKNEEKKSIEVVKNNTDNNETIAEKEIKNFFTQKAEDLRKIAEKPNLEEVLYFEEQNAKNAIKKALKDGDKTPLERIVTEKVDSDYDDTSDPYFGPYLPNDKPYRNKI